MEEIRKNLYRIQVPLPESPLKYLNSYVVRGSDRSLVIDTGLNREECYRVLRSSLEELGLDLSKTDFLITHSHADHFGLLPRVASPSTTVYCSQIEKENVDTWSGFEQMVRYAGLNGFPKGLLNDALDHHPGYKYGITTLPEVSVVRDGEYLEYGHYRFRGITTPGHTKGHLCLYEPDQKLFVAGDHLLIDITPNIQCWSDEDNLLADYLKSLEMILELDVELVLPGHRRLFSTFEQRIAGLREHHQQRLEEVLSLLAMGSKDAYQIASEMTWDIAFKSWARFPVAQRWFATGEALAHLRYLEEKGLLTRVLSESGTILYVRS